MRLLLPLSRRYRPGLFIGEPRRCLSLVSVIHLSIDNRSLESNCRAQTSLLHTDLAVQLCVRESGTAINTGIQRGLAGPQVEGRHVLLSMCSLCSCSLKVPLFVSHVGDRLLRLNRLAPMKFHVLDTNEANAFVTFGNDSFLHSGFVWFVFGLCATL